MLQDVAYEDLPSPSRSLEEQPERPIILNEDLLYTESDEFLRL